MTFIDTHCHLYDEAFDTDREEALRRALDAGIRLMLLPDIDSLSTPRLLCLWKEHPDCFRPMAGLHPTSVRENYEDELSKVKQNIMEEGIIAVGEIGIDLYWDRTFEAEQRDAFRQQMLLAEEHNLPVALHIRKAFNEVMEELRHINRPTFRGVMHCFGGSVQEAQRALEMGFYLGIGGVVTFKNATMANVVEKTPLQRILLETDAPYLAPVPHRGQRNESAYIPSIAKKIAEIKGVSLEDVAEQTSANAQELFAL